jgi:hypothetical protein
LIDLVNWPEVGSFHCKERLMPETAAKPEEFDATANFEAEVEEAIALCGGDVRAALRATLIANAYLQAEADSLAGAVSPGFARGRIRRRRKAEAQEKSAG